MAISCDHCNLHTLPYCDITQEETLEQERARLDALRQRDQERLKRFMDAKNRSIGIDKDYLDKQVEEKRRLHGVYVILFKNYVYDFMLVLEVH